ncbi:hypothetical protein ABZY09_14345 [Streptomyces sp. NPDC002928]|uniref:hypothetical protein n=1 Tax=Streptomyces sp. NPDC002928 TaxID=3154440 RepID=UPI0033ABB8C6
MPQGGVERTGTEKIQAFLKWVGGGRRLTGKGQIELADARALIEALDTGDVWDPLEQGHQYKTRSSADLYHLHRLLTWTAAGRLLHIDGDVLLPVSDSLHFTDDLTALQRALTGALVGVALAVLWWPPCLSPLSEQHDLEHALVVLWHHLTDADGPFRQPLQETQSGPRSARTSTASRSSPTARVPSRSYAATPPACCACARTSASSTPATGPGSDGRPGRGQFAAVVGCPGSSSLNRRRMSGRPSSFCG